MSDILNMTDIGHVGCYGAPTQLQPTLWPVWL